MIKFNNHIIDLIENKYTKISVIRKVLKELVEKNEFTDLHNRLYEKEKELAKIYKSKELNFQKVKSGYIALGGRPGLGKIDELIENGTTLIVTLLKETEKNVRELGELIESKNIAWIWFPLSASKLQTGDNFRIQINTLFDDLIRHLNNKEKIFIHCAAGVHRTGSFTNALLLKCGFTESESKELIYKMRPVTAIEAVTKHWNWSKKIQI